MKQKTVGPIECSCSLNKLKHALQDDGLYRQFHERSGDSQLHTSGWESTGSRTACFVTSIDSAMARAVLGAESIKVSEKTLLQEQPGQLVLSTDVKFGGVAKLAQAEANVTTKVEGTCTGCRVRVKFRVANTKHSFTEAGVLTSLVSAAKKWIAIIANHIPPYETHVNTEAAKSPRVQPGKRLSKQERIELEQQLMAGMVKDACATQNIAQHCQIQPTRRRIFKGRNRSRAGSTANARKRLTCISTLKNCQGAVDMLHAMIRSAHGMC